MQIQSRHLHHLSGRQQGRLGERHPRIENQVLGQAEEHQIHVHFCQDRHRSGRSLQRARQVSGSQVGQARPDTKFRPGSRERKGEEKRRLLLISH